MTVDATFSSAWLRLGSDEPGGRLYVADDSQTPDGGGRIRCPRCGWQPRRHDRWSCNCGHLWNTFETRGVCPACGRVWRETQCLRCHEWSPHEAWYVRDDQASG
jgi:hypothetical protein